MIRFSIQYQFFCIKSNIMKSEQRTARRANELIPIEIEIIINS